MTVKVTAANLYAIAPAAKREIVDGIVAAQASIARTGALDTPARAAMFFAQIAHESGGFTIVKESLFYTSAARLRTVWPSRFGAKTDAQLARFIRNPQALANNVYANRLGNGNAASNDGWNYIGRGVIQNTGKANYQEMGTAIGANLVATPSLLEAFPAALQAAAAFWTSRNLNSYADRGDIDGCTLRINGGYTGLADRKIYFKRAKAVHWGTDGVVPTPVAKVEYLRIGDKGPAVLALQLLLKTKGYYTEGALDSDFGPGMRAEVKAFQIAKGLLADGVYGPSTRDALNATTTSVGTPAQPDPVVAQPVPDPAADFSLILAFIAAAVVGVLVACRKGIAKLFNRKDRSNG